MLDVHQTILIGELSNNTTTSDRWAGSEKQQMGRPPPFSSQTSFERCVQLEELLGRWCVDLLLSIFYAFEGGMFGMQATGVSDVCTPWRIAVDSLSR